VRALVRRNSPRDNLAPGLRIVEGDLLDEKSLARALDGVTHVHHIAGLVSTRKRDLEKINALNYDATLNLWRACKKVERICYLGSIFALAGGSQTPLDEDAPYTLEDLPVPYFKAKRRAELATRASDLPIVFAYPGYCLGPNDIYYSSTEVVAAFLRGQMKGYIEGGISFLDVRDAAAGLDLAMQKGRIGRRYLITEHNLRWSEFFARLAKLTQLPAPKLRIPKSLASLLGSTLESVWPDAPLDRARVETMGNYFFYDNSRARSELGWSGRPLEDSLRDTVAWLRAHPRPLRRS
jgi:dihydroflavonol-4-reductase